MKKLMKRVLGVVGVGVALGMLLTGCGGDSNSPSSPASPKTLSLKDRGDLTFNGVFHYEEEPIFVEGLPPEIQIGKSGQALDLKQHGNTVSGTFTYFSKSADGVVTHYEPVNISGVLESETRVFFPPVKNIPQETVCIESHGETVCSDGGGGNRFRGGTAELSADGKSLTLSFKGEVSGYVYKDIFIRQ